MRLGREHDQLDQNSCGFFVTHVCIIVAIIIQHQQHGKTTIEDSGESVQWMEREISYLLDIWRISSGKSTQEISRDRRVLFKDKYGSLAVMNVNHQDKQIQSKPKIEIAQRSL